MSHKKYETTAEKQRAYRQRHRNALPETVAILPTPARVTVRPARQHHCHGHEQLAFYRLLGWPAKWEGCGCALCLACPTP